MGDAIPGKGVREGVGVGDARAGGSEQGGLKRELWPQSERGLSR